VSTFRQSIPAFTVHGHKIAVSSLVATAVACGVIGGVLDDSPPAQASAVAAQYPGGPSADPMPANFAQTNEAETVRDKGETFGQERVAALAAARAGAARAARAAAAAKAEAGQRARHASREREDRATGGGGGAAPVSTNAAMRDAASIVPADQLAAFDWIIAHESGWRVTARNPQSGAYGLGQALPASKMASYGSDYMTDAVTQIRWALAYMDERYGSPNAAKAWWEDHGWY
jgi:colicin import membrane protein